MIDLSVIVKDEIKKIESETQVVLHQSIPEFKECVSESAEKNVYPAYDSKEYQRRMRSGGLSDPDNYTVEEEKLSLSLTNDTPGNSAYSGSEGWDPGAITDIIESGSGYHWHNSEIYKQEPYPRPFMEDALDNFVDKHLIPSLENHFK